MSFLNNIYNNALAENNRNICFWQDYLNNLKSLDFSTFADKLKVPALVPLGSRILFRGELKHTNEVTVALGADYFVKCSLHQAEVLRQHRIKGAQSKLDLFLKEKELIESRLSFTKENLYDNQGQEILEVHTEEEDTAWRKKHKENVKKYIQNKRKEDNKEEKANDEELWDRLEELELQEELDNELLVENKEYKSDKSIVLNDEGYYPKDKEKIAKDVRNINAKIKEEEQSKYTFKHDMLQRVIEKQNELEEKLLELRNKDRSKSNTEEELISKLDEMEELEELEDEMDRLEDIIEDEDDSTEEETTNSSSLTKLNKGVTFADEDDSETLELRFTHSSTEPNSDPYDAHKGITKPSDVYAACSNLLDKTTSILKMTKYNKDSHFDVEETRIPLGTDKNIAFKDNEDLDIPNPTIVVKDVIEKTSSDNKSDKTGPRPTSLFKQRRNQMKS